MKQPILLFGIAAALSAAPVFAQSTSTTSSTSSAVSGKPSTEPVIGQLTSQGCFNSSLGLKQVSENLPFNSDGKCGIFCKEKGYDVSATYGGQECWCGDEYPPEENLIDDSECSIPCTGFKDIACGGLDAWSVYNIGVKLAVHHHDPVESTSTSSAASSPTQTSAASSTEAPDDSEPEEDDSSNSKTIGIAVGVVVAILVIGGGVGGVYWYIRKKRNQEIEEEHRRNAAVNAFINGSNAPSSSHGSISMTDSRLDPVMAHRRLSDGSIADNHDYSRKILRVTNA